MSGFDRALGTLSRREMLECARGLLKALAGDSDSAAAAAGGGGLGGDVGRAGTRGASAAAEAGAYDGGGFGLAEAGRGGRGDRQVGNRTGRARRGAVDGPGGPDGARESGEALDGTERREREVFSTLSRERGNFDRRDSRGGSGAAFAGPERRYEDAAGARGMEMSRVSDFFRRDSRRYDAGYRRY